MLLGFPSLPPRFWPSLRDWCWLRRRRSCCLRSTQATTDSHEAREYCSVTTNVTHLCSRPEVDRPFDRWPSRSIDRTTACAYPSGPWRALPGRCCFVSLISVWVCMLPPLLVVSVWRNLGAWASPLLRVSLAGRLPCACHSFFPRTGAAADDAFGACFRALFPPPPTA